ncbi:MAG TPA: hypothetical protein VIJ16_07150 [Gemmatimonadaceae bacterium]
MSHSHDTHQPNASDMKAGFLGLIIGAIVIFAILFSIVRITNHHYNSEKPAAAATN